MTAPVRVAFLGQFGVGNLGNEGLVATGIAIVGAIAPNAEISVICDDPARVTAEHGVPAFRHCATTGRWADRLPTVVAKAIEKLLDIPHTVRLVRRFDVVIVPGSGMLEILGVGPWGVPYSMFRVGLCAKVLGRRFAMIGMGAEPNALRLNRFFMRSAVRLADHVSFRDTYSRQCMVRMGADVATAGVHPDCVFAMDVPRNARTVPGLVGFGVMDYHGLGIDPGHDGPIHRRYVDATVSSVLGLVAAGHRVRLLTGQRVDALTAQVVADRVIAEAPDLGAGIEVVDSFDMAELMEHMSEAEIVVATRYHNVVGAVSLGKPTLSISYGHKNDVLLEGVGLGEFHQDIESLDPDLLLAQCAVLVARAEDLGTTVARLSAGYEDAVVEAYERLWQAVGDKELS